MDLRDSDQRGRERRSLLDNLPFDRPSGTDCYIGTIVDDQAILGIGGANPIPTTVPNFFSTNPLSLQAVEAEAAPVAMFATSRPVYVFVIGNNVPVVGDTVIAAKIKGTWIGRVARPPGSVPCGTASFVVKGCNNWPIPGASISITGPGGFTFSGITDVNGMVGFPITATGSYVVTTSAYRYTTNIFTYTLTCNRVNSNLVGLTPATGYSCASCCLYPLPNILHGTFGGQAVTLTHSATGDGALINSAGWYGTFAYGSAYLSCCTPTPGFPQTNFPDPGSGPATIYCSTDGCGAGIYTTTCTLFGTKGGFIVGLPCPPALFPLYVECKNLFVDEFFIETGGGNGLLANSGPGFLGWPCAPLVQICPTPANPWSLSMGVSAGQFVSPATDVIQFVMGAGVHCMPVVLTE